MRKVSLVGSCLKCRGRIARCQQFTDMWWRNMDPNDPDRYMLTGEWFYCQKCGEI